MNMNGRQQVVPKGKKIWIDLENSPHVPFFAPIIENLRGRGYSVLVTGRNCFQVAELVDLLNIECKIIGHHYGKHKLLKLAGLCIRVGQLVPVVLKEMPDLAVSHGSRSQLLAAKLAHVPSILIFDYEHTQKILNPEWVMAPEVVLGQAAQYKSRVLSYPGIKEDVYVPNFTPDDSILENLGLSQSDLVVTLRPPATEAHYHNPESEILFSAVIDRLMQTPNTKVVLLPRNSTQEIAIREAWPAAFESGRIMVPPKAVDGLNLIWYSDLVISGGGTMNREAAALGVPVYSIFRGKIGVLDRELARTGRLVLVESPAEVFSKIDLRQRRRPVHPESHSTATLETIVENIVSVLERKVFAEAPQPKSAIESRL